MVEVAGKYIRKRGCSLALVLLQCALDVCCCLLIIIMYSSHYWYIILQIICNYALVRYLLNLIHSGYGGGRGRGYYNSREPSEGRSSSVRGRGGRFVPGRGGRGTYRPSYGGRGGRGRFDDEQGGARGSSSIISSYSTFAGGDRPGGPPSTSTRMSSYASIADNPLPSYSDMASSMPSYASIGDSRGRGGSFDEPPSVVKRSRPNNDYDAHNNEYEYDDGPPKQRGPILTGPSRNDRLPLPGPPPDDGKRFAVSRDWTSEGGSRGGRSLSIHAAQDDHQFSRPSPRENNTPLNSEEDQFGRSKRNSFSSRGGFTRSLSSGLDRRTSVNNPGGTNTLHMSGRFQAADNTAHGNNELLQEQHSPLVRRESASSYSGIGQRFEGPPDRSLNNRSPLPLPPPPMTAPPAAPAPADHHRHPTQYSEHHTRRASDSMMTNRQADHQQQQRSQTPPPNDTSHFHTKAPLVNDAQVITAPPSPECPPSPPPAAPSGYALALARMVEMNADMEFGELFT